MNLNTLTQGSMYYQSPKEAGNNLYSYPIDIWRLGIVIYEFFTLKLTFYNSNSNSSSVLDPIIEEDFEPLT